MIQKATGTKQDSPNKAFSTPALLDASNLHDTVSQKGIARPSDIFGMLLQYANI